MSYDDLDKDYTPKINPKTVFPHYYGDVVRGCFLAASFMLLVAFLLDTAFMQLYLLIGVFAVVALVILAGMTNPKSIKMLRVGAVVSGIGFAFFEYFSLLAYIESRAFTDTSFLIRQVIAIIFIVALYYSVKSIRWMSRSHSLIED